MLKNERIVPFFDGELWVTDITRCDKPGAANWMHPAQRSFESLPASLEDDVYFMDIEKAL